MDKVPRLLEYAAVITVKSGPRKYELNCRHFRIKFKASTKGYLKLDIKMSTVRLVDCTDTAKQKP